MLRIVLMLLVFHCATSEFIVTAMQVRDVHEMVLNHSISQDKEDRRLRGSWVLDSQVKRVNVTTSYRVQMTSYKEHCFRRTEGNAKWTECLFRNRRQIRQFKEEYYTGESECLTTSSSGDKEKIKAVKQLERESRNWRKGYRFLENKCNTENPKDEEASAMCFIEYMKRDGYNDVIIRLIALKKKEMVKLFNQLEKSLNNLEECLKTQLSTYLEKVRILMESLNKCYSETTQSQEGTK